MGLSSPLRRRHSGAAVKSWVSHTLAPYDAGKHTPSELRIAQDPVCEAVGTSPLMRMPAVHASMQGQCGEPVGQCSVARTDSERDTKMTPRITLSELWAARAR